MSSGFRKQSAEEWKAAAIFVQHDFGHDLQLVFEGLTRKAKLGRWDRSGNQLQLALQDGEQNVFFGMVMAHDVERRYAGGFGEILEGDGRQLGRERQLDGGIENHALLLGTETHKGAFCIAGDACGILPDRKAKYSAARSRSSSLPVRMARATRCAETITGVMPPPGCVQWPTR